MRRREPRNPPPRRTQFGKRGNHELQLAHALARSEDFGQRTCRPATAGQLAIERSEAARHGARSRTGGRAAAPYRLAIENFLQGGHGFGYCTNVQYRTC